MIVVKLMLAIAAIAQSPKPQILIKPGPAHTADVEERTSILRYLGFSDVAIPLILVEEADEKRLQADYAATVRQAFAVVRMAEAAEPFDPKGYEDAIRAMDAASAHAHSAVQQARFDLLDRLPSVDKPKYAKGLYLR